jgi:hypothetical protein
MCRQAMISLTAVAALALAGCGAAAGGGGPTASGGGGGKGYDDAVKFSQCMRAHGVPNFPDPVRQGNRVELTIQKGQGVDPGSAQFKAAQRACRSLAPGGGAGGTVPAKVRERALAFSRCMRSHGVPNFPDPQFSGGGVRIGGAGINPNAPGFKRAQQACRALAPGAGG